MGDFDDGHPGVVEGGDDVTDVLFGELVCLGVRTITQRRVGHPDIERVGKWHDQHAHFLVEVLGHLVADLGGGSRHDVEIAGVGREEVAGALDFDEGGHAVRAIGSDRELWLDPQAISGHVGLHIRGDLVDRVDDRVVVGVLADLAEDRVTHDQRGLGRVEHDDRLAAGVPPQTSIAADVVRVNSSMLARVPGPADFDATVATISAYGTSVTRLTAWTIGIVAWPPHVTMLTFIRSRCSVRLTGGTTYGPTAAGVRSIARMPASR